MGKAAHICPAFPMLLDLVSVFACWDAPSQGHN